MPSAEKGVLLAIDADQAYSSKQLAIRCAVSKHVSGCLAPVSKPLWVCLQAAFQTTNHDGGKENSAAAAAAIAPGGTAGKSGDSPVKSPPTPWEAYCRKTLSGSAAAAVLRVVGR